ncbi:MAG: DMT family transporter [Candidatus Dactylopiibacterium sp.]|nr:DMT family transporter [Candidatus Dactylopiibacterium sp.]
MTAAQWQAVAFCPPALLPMIHVLLAAACSVLVFVLLKLARARGVDVAQAVTWNYLAASVLCALLLRPPMASLQHPDAPWGPLLALGVLLPSLFIVMAFAVREAGIVRTDIAQRLSLLLSLAAAFVFFGEQPGPVKLAGLALGLVAVLCILLRPVGATPLHPRALPALLTVWAGLAVVDVMLKKIAAAGTPSGASLQVSFVIALLCMLLWQGSRALRGQTRFTLRNFGAGLLLGALNFGNILFYVMAHKALPSQPAVVFASMNIGVVVLGTLVGAFGFGERLSRLNWLGIALAVVAIALITLAPLITLRLAPLF